MYNIDFKLYKSKCPPPDLTNVLDFDDKLKLDINKLVTKRAISSLAADASLESSYGLEPVASWNCYQLENQPGLIFIRNPFTWRGQRYWTKRCLKDYTRKPQRLNIDKHGLLKGDTDYWEQSTTDKSLVGKLRWATLGYHHNWDTKVYDESSKDEFPEDLAGLTRYVCLVCGFPDFKAEAAIVNYYYMNSTLSGHTDYSEPNRNAPLLSMSLGQTAIFLIGGLTRDEKPTPMFLRSGDIVIMSGESRLHYHGVPRVMKSEDVRWDEAGHKRTKLEDDWDRFGSFLSLSRININVRQVLHPGNVSLVCENQAPT